MSTEGFDNQGCDCCEPPPSSNLPLIYNRPGLPAIQYRLGTFRSFQASILLEASRSRNPFLDRWLARDTHDYGVAIAGMWATVADILTFYQERIANEAFLRTATHRESVVRLAALLDYKPSPGAAAQTYLAFILEKQKQLVIPMGLRSQSVPGQNEKPQKFETVETIQADAKYNQFRIYSSPEPYNPLARSSDHATLLAVVPVISARPLAARDRLVLFDHRKTEVKEIVRVYKEDERTLFQWSAPVLGATFTPFNAGLATWGRQIAAFGWNAPETYMEPTEDPSAPGGMRWVIRTSYYALDLSASGSLPLESKADDIKPGAQVLMVYAPTREGQARFARRASVISNDAIPMKFESLTATVSVLKLGFSITTPPATAVDARGRLHVFVAADDDAVWYQRQSLAGIGRWTGWLSLGGKVTSISVERDSVGNIHVFAAGVDRYVWHAAQLSADVWSEWERIGNARAEVLAAVRHPDGRFAVFARNPEGRVHFIEQNANGTWNTWTSLGGQVDLLAAALNANGGFEVFGRGPQNDLVYRRRVSASGEWTAWKSLGGSIDLLAAGRNANGRIDVFARGKDYALWVNHQTAPGSTSWTGWRSLGGWIDQLVVTNSLSGRLEVFARGPDKAVWWNRQTEPNTTTFAGWQRAGGVVDLFGAGANTDGRLELFAREPDQALWRSQQASNAGEFGPFTTHGYPMWPVPDRRGLTVFELTSSPIPISEYTYPQSIRGNSVAVPMTSMDRFDKGRTIIIDDAGQDAQAARVISVSQHLNHWVLGIDPALKRRYDPGTAFAYGNVARSTHGETIKNEILGSGDAAQRFQTFDLQKSPVTFVPNAAAANGVASTLEVRVDGILWKEVRTLLGQGAGERVYSTNVSEAGVMTVQFGGAPASRLPSGRGNVTAKYRQGLGPDGNVRRGTITTLLDRPPGLKSGTNPIPAEGGSAGESIELARKNAPNTVRTFERIVSLRDFEDASREHALVAKARARWVWDGDEQAVVLTVAGSGGQVLSQLSLLEIVAYLNVRRDPNRKMTVRRHRSLGVLLSVRVQVHPDYLLENVHNELKAALNSYFAFDRLELGQPVLLIDIYRVLHREVPGVVASDIDALSLKGSSAHPVADLGIPEDGIASIEAAADLMVSVQFAVL